MIILVNIFDELVESWNIIHFYDGYNLGILIQVQRSLDNKQVDFYMVPYVKWESKA